MHSTPESDRDPVTGESPRGYEPPADAPIPLATPKPKLKTLDKKKVGILLGVAGVLVAFAFVSAFMPKAQREQEKDDAGLRGTTAAKSESFNALPDDYASAAALRAQNVPQLGRPMPGDIGQLQYDSQQKAAGQAGYTTNNAQLTAYHQAVAQQELERLKRAADARDAVPTFGSRSGRDSLANPLAGLSGGLPGALPSTLQSQLEAARAAAGAGDTTARDDDNRQDDKRGFLSTKGDAGTLAKPVRPPASPYVVSAGTLIPALFLTGINSDLPGQITAQVSQPVYDTPSGRYVVIPQGAVLVGTYDSRVTFGQDRVLLVWQRLRFPNGASLDLEAMPGVDMSGYAGVTDKVNNHWGKVVSSVALTSVLAAAVAVSEGDNFSALEGSAGQSAAQGAGQAVNQAGSQIVQRSLKIQPTLEIRPGQRVAVMVNKDLALLPYVQ